MKKILILLTIFFIALLFIKAVFAAELDDEFANPESDYSEDLFDDFGNDGDEFDIFDSDSENINGTIFMQGERLDSDIFKLSIAAKEFTTPVLGIAFHLLYGKNKLAFLKYEPGDFLERGGDPFYLVKNDEDLNKIVFGETLRKNDTFPIGDGIISTLYFQVLDGEDFNFEFNNGVISTLDTVRQDMDLISWENFSFGKNATSSENIGAASTLNINQFDYSSILTIAIMFAAAIPTVYFIIKAVKKYSKLNFPAQTN